MKKIAQKMSLAILICFFSSPVMGQSKEQGIRLFNEGKKIHDSAESNLGKKKICQEYERALEKYLKAQRIFEEINFDKGLAIVLYNSGNIHRDCKRYDVAAEYYIKAESLYRGLALQGHQCDALENLAVVYLKSGELQKSAEVFQKAFSIAKNMKEEKREGNLLKRLGDVYSTWLQYSKAANFYLQSIEINRKSGEACSEAETLNSLGIVYREWGRYSDAAEKHLQSLEICKNERNIRCEAIALFSLGQVYTSQGKYTETRECFEKALTIFRKIGDVENEAISLVELGRFYNAHREHAKALAYLEKGLELYRKSGDEPGEGHALVQLAIVYSIWGQYLKANELYEKSLEISRKNGDVQGQADILMNQGDLYKDLGQYSNAIENYKKSIAVYHRLGLEYAEGWIHKRLGLLYAQQGEHQKALGSLEKSLYIAEQYKSNTHEIKRAIGDVYLQMGDIEKAVPFVTYWIYSPSNCRVNLLKNKYAGAKSCYEMLYRWAQKNRRADWLFVASTGLGHVFEEMKDNTRAAEHYREAIKMIEEHRVELDRKQREQFFDVQIEGFYRTAPYKGLARVLMGMNKPVEAFQLSEYTKARIFAEGFSKLSGGQRLDVPVEIVEKDSELNEQIANLKKSRQEAHEKEHREIITSLDPQIKDLESKLATHITVLRAKYPLFAATKYPQPMDLKQTALRENEWVLAYDVTDSGIIIYLTEGRRLIKGLFKPIPIKELDGLVRKFRKPMEIGPSDSVISKLASFDFASGKNLSDILLADILPDLPKDVPVIIVPDGSLGVIPFEMLVLNDEGKVAEEKGGLETAEVEFFGDRNPISYYQSITALTLARTLVKHKRQGDKMLAMVDPVFSSDDPRLAQYPNQEKEKLLANLPKDLLMSIQVECQLNFPRLPLTGELGEGLKKADPSRTELYQGIAAKKSVLFEKDLIAYRSLVFATHGYFGKDLPTIKEPVLVFNLIDQAKDRDGFLKMTEVMGLKLNADIVILAACQTGLGRLISGEGTTGMGRAFQYAGSKSVLMTLWSVAEKSTVMLVECFFKHLREGKNKLEALRLAREEIRKTGYDHPFFWAPFILVGEVN